MQLEKLQAENAAEFSKREKLESEKLAMERENKNLKSEIENLQELVELKSKQASAAVDTDLRSIHQDLSERTKVTTRVSCSLGIAIAVACHFLQNCS